MSVATTDIPKTVFLHFLEQIIRMPPVLTINDLLTPSEIQVNMILSKKSPIC